MKPDDTPNFAGRAFTIKNRRRPGHKPPPDPVACPRCYQPNRNPNGYCTKHQAHAP